MIPPHGTADSSALLFIEALLDFLLKSSLCFAAAFAMARMTRSAARRFALWIVYLTGTLAYAIFLAVPLLLPQLPAGMLPGHAPASTATMQVSTPSAAPVPAAARTAPARPLWTIPASFATHAGTLFLIAGLFYLAAVTFAFLSHLRQQLLLRRALVFSYEPSSDLQQLALLLAETLGVRHTRLMILPGIASPATIGWLKPLVLLPAVCEQQSLSESADILRHELHHIRRRDWLLDHVARAIRALLFFQPAVWIACRELRLERELACDQAVIGSLPETRARYAESLVRFARFSSLAFATAQPSPRNSVFGMDFAASTTDLHTRVQAILTLPDTRNRGLFVLQTLGRTALLLLLVAGLPYLTVTLAYTVAATRPSVASAFPVATLLSSPIVPLAHPTRQTLQPRVPDQVKPRAAEVGLLNAPAVPHLVSLSAPTPTSASSAPLFAAAPAPVDVRVRLQPEPETISSDVSILQPALSSRPSFVPVPAGRPFASPPLVDPGHSTMGRGAPAPPRNGGSVRPVAGPMSRGGHGRGRV